MGDGMMTRAAQDSSNNSFVFESKTLIANSFNKLYEFLQGEILCDLEIRVGSKSFKCHKAVLASCSAYFRAMFTSGLSESRQNVITICEVEAASMKKLIEFAYTAKIELDCDNVQSVLHAASVLQLDSLTQGCCQFMEANLHPTNCLGVSQFAERHGLMSLTHSADAFTLRHFHKVLAQAEDEFAAATATHLQDLISSPDLCVESEIQVFEAVMKWVSHDTEKRKGLLPVLLSHVRLPLLPTPYLLNQVENHELVRRSIECRDLVDQARDFKLWQADLIPSLNGAQNMERCRPRKSCSGMLFCVGGRGISGDPFASVECYSPLRNKWFCARSMTTKRRHVGCVFAEGRLYAVGGCNEKEHLASAEVYDMRKDCWTMLAPMAVPRRGLGTCFMGGALYAVGGLDDLAFYAVVERYDISSDSWTLVSTMKTPRGGVAVARLRDHLYAIGGNNGPFSLSSCERYDPHLNKWAFLAPMNQCRAGAGAAVLNGMLYAVGGFDNNLPLSSVERYHFELDTWTLICPMQVPRGGVGVATLGGKLLAIGGHNGTSYLCSVEIYDPLTDRWSQLSNIQLSRAGAGVTWCPCTLHQLEMLEENKEQTEEEGVKDTPPTPPIVSSNGLPMSRSAMQI